MIVLLLIGLGFRLSWTAYRWSGSPGGPALQFPDEHDYWTGAVSLGKGGGLVDADGRRATRMPLYPALLSLVAGLPDGAWYARIAQGVLGALAALVVGALAWRLAGPAAGWLAGAFVAVDPFAVYFSHLLLTETLVTTCLAALWWIGWPLALPDGRARTWRWPVTGALFLLLVYLHPSFIGLVPAWALFVAIGARRSRRNFPGVNLVCLIVLIGLAPWCWRNYQLLGYPVALTTRSGISLFDALGPQADGSSNLGFTRDLPENRLPEVQWNRAFREQTLRAVRADPWRVCRLAWVKLRRTWNPLPNAAEAQSRGVRAISAVWTVCVFALMGVGIGYWRRDLGVCLLLLLPAVYVTGVHAVFVGSIRYRLPVMPLIEVLSAVGLAGLVGLVRPAWRPLRPPSEPPRSDYEPVSALQQWFAVRRYARHPVPLWRRRFALALLLVLTLGYYAYQYFTSDERIRRQAANFLTQFTGGEVRIGQARFSFFGGVALRDVMIALPGHIDFDPTARSLEERRIFTARNLRLHHEPFALLTGRLKVVEIVADHPTVTLVKNPGHPTYTYNWQTLFPARPQKPGRARGRLPSIYVRNARVQIIEIREQQRHPEPEIELSAVALPDPDPHRNAYVIPWRKLGDPPERGHLFYKLGAGTYSGELPSVPVTTVKASLPPPYTEWLEALEIAGQIKPEQIQYDQRHGSRAVIGLEGVRLSVPTHTEERPTTQAAGRFLKLSDVRGQLVLTPTESTARFRGLLNGSPCSVTAVVTNYAGPLEEVGFTIHLRTTGVRLPDPKDPAGARFIDRVQKVRSFFNDFDPHGRVDLDVHLFKSPGRDMGVILRGTMTALDCDASYRHFPYRCDRIRGTVRFADDGVWLEDLVCHHGSGVVVINGRVDGTNWYDGLQLDIAADSVPLDPDLFEAVPETFRAIWRRFNPVGLAHLNIRLGRTAGTAETGPGAWSTQIVADLVETRVCFLGFPYRLDHVSGRLLIDNNRITAQGLVGRRGPASARFDGQAYHGSGNDSRVEFRLQVCDLPLDEVLADALPAEARRTFDQYQPSGRADLLGRVFMNDGAGGMSYSLGAHLRDAAICYESLPYRIDRIQGDLVFTPEAIHLVTIAGHRGVTDVSARGRIERRDDEYLTHVTVCCNRLQLDEALYQALPADLRRMWDALRPTGPVNLTTRIRRAGTGPGQISTHDTVIQALGNDVCYAALPLPITQVRGQIHLTDESAELIDLTGRYGPGRIRLNGRIPLVGHERIGRFRLNVDGVPFDEGLRRALPARFREVWDSIKPTGMFDMDLTELNYHSAPNQPTRWTYRGRVGLKDAALDLGFQASQIEGNLIGHGTAQTDGSEVTVDAALELKRIAVNQRVLTDVTGRMRREPGSNILRLDDLAGRAYGGQAAGFGQVRFEPAETSYALYMIARDMSLGPFLNATRPKDSPPVQASGTVDGRLYLRGVSGRVDSRQGTGEVHIRQAQMYKLPFVLAMLSAINITIPDENAFHDAHASFEIQANRLHFDTIELKGRSLSMLGSGSMDTETEQLDLTFITGSPHDLPRIPLLIELARGASRELMEIAITGPLSKPTMRGRPLYSLRMTLEALFPQHPNGVGSP